MPHSRSALVLVALLVLLPAASAQVLSVNGSTSQAYVPIGATMQLELQGQAAAPHLWLFNTDPGPSMLLGETIPVGLGPNVLDISQGAPLPPGGILQLPVNIPNAAVLSGLTFYSAAIIIDGSGMNGFSVSNGIEFTFVVPGADAGPDAAAIANRELVLDGGANLDASGQIPAGTSFQWVVSDVPAGAITLLTGDQTAFPSFVGDLPGIYTVDLQITGPNGFSADRMEIALYDVVFASPADGSFSTGPVPVNGQIVGPPAQQILLNGSALTLNGTAFDAGMQPINPVMNPFTLRIETPGGAVVEDSVTVIEGTAAPLATPASPALALRLAGVQLDALEPPVEALVAALPLNQIVTAIPPLPVTNTALFSATITFTGATFDTQNVNFDIFPSNGALGVSLTLNNLQITSTIDGSLVFAPYSETATLSATSAVISGEYVIGANAMGELTLTAQNTMTTLNGFNLQVTGVLGGLTQLGLIQTAFQGAIELALTGILDLIPPALNPVLAAIPLSVDLSAQGIPVQIDFPLNSVVYDPAGITIATDFGVTPLMMGSESPNITDYRTTAGTVPAYGATTDVLGLPYDLAFGLNDDLLNQLLAAAVTSGALDIDVDDSLIGGTGAAVFDTTSLGLLLPMAGFEAFPPMTPVTIAIRHTTAPVVTIGGSGMDTATLHAGGLLLDFLVEVAPGTEVPALRLGVTLTSGLQISIDAMTGNLQLTPTTINASTTLRGAVAGFDPTATLAGLNTVLQLLLPQLTGPLGNIPLGIGLVNEISISPTSPDTISLFSDLP